MEQKPIRKFRFRRLVAIISLIFIGLTSLLLLPATQTYLGQRLASRVADKFGTNFSIGQVQVSPFGYATFRNVLAIDHKQDTLIYSGYVRLNALRLRAVLQGDNNLGDVLLRDVVCNIITYNAENQSNIDQFFKRFSNPDKSNKLKSTFLLSSIRMLNAQLKINNKNKTARAPLIFSNLNADIENFALSGSDLSTNIVQLDAETTWNNTQITSLRGNYMYSPTSMKLSEATIQTASSIANLDVELAYPIKGLTSFVDSVNFDIDLEKALLGTDLGGLIQSELPFEQGQLSGVISGTLNELSAKDLTLTIGSNRLILSAACSNLLYPNRSFRSAVELKLDDTSQVLPGSLAANTRALIDRFGSVDASGTLTLSKGVWKMDTSLKSAFGPLEAFIALDTSNPKVSYNMKLFSQRFNLGGMANVKTLGTSGLDIVLSGKGLDLKNLSADAKGTLTNLLFRGYGYDQIQLEGSINPQFFSGNLLVNDAAANLDLSGKINFDTVRNFSFTSTIEKADLVSLGWVKNSDKSIFSGSVDLALQGNSIDDMIGDLYVEDGNLTTATNKFAFSSLAVQSRQNDAVRVINVSSDDIASGVMIGQFQPTEFFKLIQNTLGAQHQNYLPHKIAPDQYVDFNFNIKGKIAAAFFGNKINLDDNTFIQGAVSSQTNNFQLSVRAPRVDIFDAELTNIDFKIDTQNPDNYSLLSVEALAHDRANVHKLTVKTHFQDDLLFGNAIFYLNEDFQTESALKTTFTFDQQQRAVLGFQDAFFAFDNTNWQLKKSASYPMLRFKNSKEFSLSELSLTNGDADISITASQSGNDSFSLNANFTQVVMEELLSFKKDKWSGVLDGFLNISQSSTGIEGNSNLNIRNLYLNDVALGSAALRLQSDEGEDAYQLAIRLEDDEAAVVTASGLIGFEKQKPVFDLDFVFHDYDLSLLAGLTTNVFDPFTGNANGLINLVSNDDGISANGVLQVDDLILSVPYLNTTYEFTNTVPFDFSSSTIQINDASFVAKNATQKGLLNGRLTHQSFDNWSLDMRIDAENLNVLDTEFSQTALYYGDAFFTGNAHLYGPFSNMQIDVIGETAQGTNMFIPIQFDTAIGDVSYINFVEKEQASEQDKEINANVKGLQLSFDLDVTPDAQVEIVVDPETKSSIRGTGAGNLLLEIDTAGSFAMWGDFIALDGIYNFKNLGLLDKKFVLESGGTIVWEGDPLAAQINMRAIYEVPGGANPSVLIDGDNVSQKIPTAVTINLFGNLLNPETPTFEIDFPNTSGVVKNELNYRLNDQERRQLQAISLLSQGSFINEVSLEAISSQTLTNNLFQKASGVFDNIFANENDQLNLSLNYLQGDRNAAASIKNRDRLGLNLSTNINERILIDGKVGVPVGGEDETMIIGNVTLEFLLNPQGTLRARVFNKENEFQYFGDELGYTQGVGIAYQVRFNSFNELVRKIFSKK